MLNEILKNNKVKGFDHNSGEYLNIDSARIYYEVNGNEDYPALLFLHGGFGNIEDFNDMIPDLQEEFRVIGIDSRGHGKSTQGSKESTYELLQNDVEKVLEYLKIKTLNILGFSDGGIVAYRLASFTRLNIIKLITIGSRWHLKNVEPLKEVFIKITPENWKRKFPQHFDSYQRLNPEPDFNRLTKQLVKMWMDTSASGYPNELVKRITCPTFIIRGENDTILSRPSMEELTGLMKNSRVQNIHNAGHMAFIDQKELFVTSLNKFLNE